MKDFNCKHAFRNECKQVACNIDNKPCKYQRWCEMDGEWQTTNQCITCEKGKGNMTEEIKKEAPKKEVKKQIATVVDIDGYGTYVEYELNGDTYRVLLPYDFTHKIGDKVEI